MGGSIHLSVAVGQGDVRPRRALLPAHAQPSSVAAALHAAGYARGGQVELRFRGDPAAGRVPQRALDDQAPAERGRQ